MAIWRTEGFILVEQTLGELVSFREALWQLIERIDPDAEQDEAVDPFAAWERSMAACDAPADPVVDRLFPNPYGDDPVAGAEWRRYSLDDARRQRCAELAMALDAVNNTIADVIADREAAGFPGDLRVDLIGLLHIEEGSVEQWLRATNLCRLAMSHELGITTADEAEELDDVDPEDPRFYDAVRYWALGDLQLQILFILDGDIGF